MTSLRPYMGKQITAYFQNVPLGKRATATEDNFECYWAVSEASHCPTGYKFDSKFRCGRASRSRSISRRRSRARTCPTSCLDSQPHVSHVLVSGGMMAERAAAEGEDIHVLES